MKREGQTKSKIGRRKAKAAIIPFKLREDLDAYLRNESDKTGRTMVGIVEELLDYRRRFKTFPPLP